MSTLTLIADQIVLKGLAFIAYLLLSLLTLIAEENVPMFGLHSLLACFMLMLIDKELYLD